MLLQELTSKVLAGYYKVYNGLGYGFLEKVYENAVYNELTGKGLNCQKQVPITVYYEGAIVGDYYADLVVEGTLIIEIKAAEVIVNAHECQLINYLKATDIEVGLLLNFGKNPQFSRKIFTNDRKPHLVKQNK
jgi:GxxExxY protein